MWRQQDMCIDSAIKASQQGDAVARNYVLEHFSPHILRVGGAFIGRYISISHDEYSVGLAALDEAISKYNADKGASFQAFFEIVLKRRLIDHIRKTSRVREIPRSSLQPTLDEEFFDTDVEVVQAQQRYQEQTLTRERADEIAALSQELSLFGLSFSDLPAHSPKHSDARKTAIRIAASLVRDGELWEGFLQRRLLPVGSLAEEQGVNRKTVERNRKYIVAVALILGGDYPLLSQYVEGI